MTKEQLQKYAVDNGIFESLKANKNVTLTIKSGTKVAGFLKLLREVFPENYVDKYGYTYTIYAGDKKTQEILNKPIKSFSQSPKKMWEKARNELLNGFESKEDYDFVTSIVKKVTDGNEKIHTLSVRRVKKNLEVVINDVRCIFKDFDLSKALWTTKGSEWKQSFEERVTEQLNKVIEQEFKA